MTQSSQPQIPETLSILVGDKTVFPNSIFSIRITSEPNLKLLNDVLQAPQPMIGVATIPCLHAVGCLTIISESKKISEKEIYILLEGLHRIQIGEYVQNSPYLIAKIALLSDETVEEDKEMEEWKLKLKLGIKKIRKFDPDYPPPPELRQLLAIEEPGLLADMTALYYLDSEEQQDILATLNVKERLKKAVDHLYAENSDQANGHHQKIIQANMPPEVEKEALETLERLSNMPPSAGEYSYLETWLNWMESLPWSKSTEDRVDIQAAENILEEDHFALENVKKRILEFLAVKTLNPQGKGPILCFIGPPGTGKTSVGKSIARAMGRKFIRVSLGGVYDESQIRGHRRTYVGALPGIIIENLKKANSNNPVFMIDEIDKIGASAQHGDPSSALLEALDPEQNSSFSDHYLGVPFNLSKVLFICTGNLAEPIQPALRDRLEILDFPGYTKEEKLMIAKKYLVPRQLEANGLREEQLVFQWKALQSIIESYTQEAGVRNLEREISNVCRFVATKIARGEISQEQITEKKISKILGPKRCIFEAKERISRSGVATGLAWTPAGGCLLFIETEVVWEEKKQTKSPPPEVTGNVEKIMHESAQIALTFVRANRKMLGIPDDRSPVGRQVYIHVPEGATQKDGPSAGLAIFVALVSLFTKKKIRHDVAISGEINIRGLVGPVGGIKEKVLAAKEAGMKIIILPKENEKDVPDLPLSVREALKRGEIEIKFISEAKEALPIAFNDNNDKG